MDITATPEFQAAAASVTSALAAEGQGAADVTFATSQLADTAQQLYNAGGVAAQEALNGAVDYIKLGHTVAGAVGQVQGLVQIASSGDPSAIMQAFTGTMVGVCATLGPVSAGVGAAIVLGVGALLSALDGGGSPGFSIPGCDGLKFSAPPTYAVGCVGVFGQTARPQPGSLAWSAFPDPNKDPSWFDTTQSGGFSWKGSDWHTYINMPRCPRVAAINRAFPDYASLVCNLNNPDYDPQMAAFYRAFVAAWKLNKEYALNGLKLPAADWQVLQHTVRLWNMANGHSAYRIIQPGSVDCNIANVDHSYVAALILGLHTINNKDPFVMNNMTPAGGLIINTGAPVSTAPMPLKNSSTLASVAKGGAVLAAGAGLGVLLHAWLAGKAVDLVIAHGWNGLKTAISNIPKEFKGSMETPRRISKLRRRS